MPLARKETISRTAKLWGLVAALVVATVAVLTDASAPVFYASILAMAIVTFGLQARADRADQRRR